MPAMSVVMPVYNRAQSVRRAIDSVLQQSFSDFELVIVDDGSRDGTPDRVRDIADPRIRLLVQAENRGGNAARNRGVREAEAPLVSFLDSDDEFLPHKLQAIFDYFASNPHVDAVVDSFELLYPPEKGGGKALRINPPLNTSAAVREAIFTRKLYKATPALSARKAALINAGLFDETLKRRQDMDLVLRLAESCEMRSINTVLWTKYWTQDAISSKQNTFMPALLDICERHPDYLANPRYRKGLARDFARHFLRLGVKGRFGTVSHDFGLFAARYSTTKALALFTQGLWEMILRFGQV